MGNDGGQGQAPDAEAGRVQDLDSRFQKIETEQQAQRGLLDDIKNLVSGAKGEEGKAHQAAEQHTETRLERGTTIADQVKKAVAEVGAEQEEARRRAEHDAEHERIRGQAKAEEGTPRPRQPTWKEKWQSKMFGGDQ